MVQTHQVEDRGMQVMHLQPVADRLVAELVCLPVGDPSLDAPPCHPDRIGMGIMISPWLGPRLGNRQPSEFTTPDQQRVVQQALLLVSTQFLSH